MSDAREGRIERVIDANANRAREGLRVAEDFARFVVADESLAKALRDTRHRVTEAVGLVAPSETLLAARDTEGDLGADADAFPPAPRRAPQDVAASALKRAEEALRSLAEFAKLVDPGASAAFERERYALYDLEKRVLLARADVLRMSDVRLCAVMDAAAAPAPADVASAAVEAGAGCLVTELGALDDATALSLAKGLRGEVASQGGVLLVAARADVALLAGADGVLLGPGDVSPAEARRVMGTGAVVGLKVPGADEARAAVGEGATFVIVPFANLRGMASGHEGVWFASALAPEHARAVVEAGARRIALGLPDSPEGAAELVRAAREALDKARPLE
ncbi:MAG: thiamine phosphate synthase [Planctomycetota bacterium]